MKEEKKERKRLTLTFVLFFTLYSVICFFLICKPDIDSNYEALYNYQEETYAGYEEEAKRMIQENDYSKCKYRFMYEDFPEDKCIELKIGDFLENEINSAYINVTITNAGTDEQKYEIERSIESEESSIAKGDDYKVNKIIQFLIIASLGYLFIILIFIT